jgi:FkbH-like protein
MIKNNDLGKIKLVVWDLDNTFWKGTISEIEIQPIISNCELVVSLTDCGIINTICSKNDYAVCDQKLKELNVRDYFVFSSIDWRPKGQRIKEIIKSMALRPENVLFIDDEVANLREAQHYLPELMVAEPQIIDQLRKYTGIIEKKDISHSRLKQYKLLELKNVEQQKYNNNEDFLFHSDIRVTISEDCKNELERVHELIQRSNQLNFTKKRISIEELSDLFDKKEVRCGSVSVNDKFGNYGIVGFYAVAENRLEHFLFSCRTIGLGVEQYVYSVLNWPELDIAGEVVSELKKIVPPRWINQTDNIVGRSELSDETIEQPVKSAKVLIKGPCDLSKSMTYIKSSDLFDYEFTYVNEKAGNIIEAHNHSVHILGLKEYTYEQKNEIVSDCIFIDRDMLTGQFFEKKYDIIVLSTLIESNYGIYRKRNSGIRVAFGSNLIPLTDKQNWQHYIHGTIYTGNNVFTENYLTAFSEKYEFLGKTIPYDYIDRIKCMLNYLDKQTTLCLLLGVEFPCDKNKDTSFENRHNYHAELNAAVRSLAKEYSQIKLIDLNDIVKNQADFADGINHFTSRVYYEIAKRISSVINEKQDVQIQNYSTIFIYFDRVILLIRAIFKKTFDVNSSSYKLFKKVYLIISRKKK